MGNPNIKRTSGPCSACNANMGPWNGEPDTVRCARPGDSYRHVMRGSDATIRAHDCWKPKGQELPLEAVMALVMPPKRRPLL